MEYYLLQSIGPNEIISLGLSSPMES